jgi:predicted nucleic acid-binding protein
MKFFWDTNLFIYLWEDSPQRAEALDFAAAIKAGNHELATSALTVGEVLVQPFRLKSGEAAGSFLSAFAGMEVVPFGIGEAGTFARLRAANASLRPPDAIQLACAAAAGADVFVTNDNRLSRISVSGVGRICAFASWRSCFAG